MRAAWPGLTDLARRAADDLAAERRRLSLWLPVALSLGVAGYFALPGEPPPALTGLALALLVSAWRLAPWRSAQTALVPLLVLAAGAFWASVHTARTAAPVLDRSLGAVMLQGRVLAQEPLAEGGLRLILAVDPERWSGPAAPPVKVRLNVRTDRPDRLSAGDMVRLRARLNPPPGPTMPGDFDFARLAFFERWGAVGYAVSPVDRLAPAAGSDGRIQRLREQVLQAI
ncbi:MAG: ComEC/Rec2 family competence protein [Rhodothalassiaceae bacterium]